MIPLDTLYENPSTLVEIHQGKNLNVNSKLETSQQDQLIKMLQEHSSAFTWDYIDMKGIQHSLLIHHIYNKEYSRHVR